MKVNNVKKTYSIIAAECRPGMIYLVEIDGESYEITSSL